jgi:putative addiction module component (TIGR02574 family)
VGIGWAGERLYDKVHVWYRLDGGVELQSDIRALIEAALKLSPAARGALASRLLDSLQDGEVDPDAEVAWEAEISQRLKELDSKLVRTIPWSEARQQILRAK